MMSMPEQSESRWQEAVALLDLTPDADEAAVRAAYLRQVRLHSPDREPDLFERIRDAYQLLQDPRLRAAAVLEGPHPGAPLIHLLQETSSARKFVGPRPWLAVLQERPA